MSDLPSPLTTPLIDLRDYPSFLFDADRFLASEINDIGTGEEIAAALRLWCRAWQQVPIASLPDNPRVLAAFARVSADRWDEVKEVAMRGFIKCSDGRWYNKTLAEVAINAWDNRRKNAVEAARKQSSRDEMNDLIAALKAAGVAVPPHPTLKGLRSLVLAHIGPKESGQTPDNHRTEGGTNAGRTPNVRAMSRGASGQTHRTEGGTNALKVKEEEEEKEEGGRRKKETTSTAARAKDLAENLPDPPKPLPASPPKNPAGSSPTPSPGPDPEVERWRTRILATIGVKPNEVLEKLGMKWTSLHACILDWQGLGADLERHVIPAIVEAIARKPAASISPKYFTPAIQERIAAPKAQTGKAAPSQPSSRYAALAEQRRGRLEIWIVNRTWPPDWGPQPGKAGSEFTQADVDTVDADMARGNCVVVKADDYRRSKRAA